MPEERPLEERPAARPRATSPAASSPQVPQGPTINQKKPWKPGCLFYSLIIIAIFTIFFIIAGMGGSSGSGTDGLVVACQQVVKKNLKAPSTASFVGVPVASGNIITGQVDAQNGFGAQIRSSFQCTIIDKDTVRLDFLN